MESNTFFLGILFDAICRGDAPETCVGVSSTF